MKAFYLVIQIKTKQKEKKNQWGYPFVAELLLEAVIY